MSEGAVGPKSGLASNFRLALRDARLIWLDDYRHKRSIPSLVTVWLVLDSGGSCGLSQLAAA